MSKISTLSEYIKWYFTGIISDTSSKIKLLRVKNTNQWIFSRTSCLGNDIINIIQPNYHVFNVQKGRSDFLVSQRKSEMTLLRRFIIITSLKRINVFPLVTRQHVNIWRKMNSPKFIFMDSYSELSDYLFVNKKDNWRFLANYFDINHDDKFKSKFNNLGLIPTLEFINVYRSYLVFVNNTYKNVPVIFLLMPTQLEKRREYVKRSQAIYEAVMQLKIEFSFLHILQVGEDVVNFLPENATNPIDPYHFHTDVYKSFAIQLKKLEFFQ